MNRIALMLLKNTFRIPGLFGKLWHYANNTDKYPEEEKWLHIHKILKIAVESGNIDLVVTGYENLPEENGFMLYGNHQGMFDVVALAATCERPLAAVLKKELYNVPLLHQIALCTNSFAMDREDVRQSLKVIQAVIEEVKKGRNYLIFPEGTRSKNGNVMGEFHAGSFRCATKTKCPVVPLAFVDCFKPMDEKGSQPVRVQLHYLPAIYYEEYKDMKPQDLANLVRSRIEAKIAECVE